MICSELERLMQEQQTAERSLNEALQLKSGPQPLSSSRQQEAESALRWHVEACERLIKHRAQHGC